MIEFGRASCGNFDSASTKEWLETNGLGGYASGTVAGVNTRSYHSLLTLPLEAPLKRALLLAQLEEVVTYGEEKIIISSMQYEDVVQPKGFHYLESFRLDPFPVFVYRIGDQLLEKTICMSHGERNVWIVYRLLTKPQESFTLSVKPLLSFRFHHLRKQNKIFVNTHHDLDKHFIKILPDQQIPAMYLYHNASGYEHSAQWFNNVFYREEQLRALDCEEDLFAPGRFDFILDQEPSGFISATIDEMEEPDFEAALKKERGRRKALVSSVPAKDEFGRQLLLAADQFLVKRKDGLSVIAGYPWLGDSGRDSMIAVRGLAIAPERLEEGKVILKTLAGYCSEGMLPNVFTEDHSRPLYNAVDTALWFFVAVDYYKNQTQNDSFVKEELWSTMEDIVDHYIKGSRFGIRMDTDGLINIPEEGAQITWMDAQVGDWVVTPRSGKPVEVNALWYNVLCIMTDLTQKFNQPEAHERFARMAAKTRESLIKLFWNDEAEYLYDRIEDYYQDKSFRPNQLFALSLPYPLFEGKQAEAIINNVKRSLYTSFGFRSLDPKDPEYKGEYSGDLIHREGAAYQGTVWPWLIGAYADALRNCFGDTKSVKQEIDQLLKPFKSHINEYGIGTVSEMFDGNVPHHARGCIAKASSVSEILRVHLENSR